MVEHAEQGEGEVWAAAGRSLRAEENIVRRGSEARLGEMLLAAGTAMGAAEIAVAAACGCVELAVRKRPVVAIVATGDELVEVNETAGGHQIRNSNGYALAALVEAAGGQARAAGDCAGHAGEFAGENCGGARGAICCCCRVGSRWGSTIWWRRCWRSLARSFSLPE